MVPLTPLCLPWVYGFKVELHKTATLLPWNPSVGNTGRDLMWPGGWETAGLWHFVCFLPFWSHSSFLLVDWDCTVVSCNMSFSAAGIECSFRIYLRVYYQVQVTSRCKSTVNA